jgi:hypothetical protein
LIGEAVRDNLTFMALAFPLLPLQVSSCGVPVLIGPQDAEVHCLAPVLEKLG